MVQLFKKWQKLINISISKFKALIKNSFINSYNDLQSYLSTFVYQIKNLKKKQKIIVSLRITLLLTSSFSAHVILYYQLLVK